MELEQEKQSGRAARESRELSQRILRRIAPCSVKLLGENELLEQELKECGVQIADRGAELLIWDGAEELLLPGDDAQKVLLVCADAAKLAKAVQELAQQGYYRSFAWNDAESAPRTALFVREEAPQEVLVEGYEQELDAVHQRLCAAEHAAQEQDAQLERLRRDLELARSHEQTLEQTLNSVTGSTFWKMTWPLRYLVSKCRQILGRIPLFAFLALARQEGFDGARSTLKARREYETLFPGKTLCAERFVPQELLIRQAANQPDAGKISIVLPLYDPPVEFLTELLDSVENQTYRNWELCCADAGQDPEIGQMIQTRAAADPRIRYEKLAHNEGIAGNTNRGFAMAEGGFVALLDHDDILHPCALWYAAQAIAQKGADFIYTDEATFEGSVENVLLYHFKPDFALDNLRSNNYICHLSVFRRTLLETVGGAEYTEFDGSQDYDLILRLTEQAETIVHIPHALYYWRSSPTSTAGNIYAKSGCIEVGAAALRAHYARCGVPVDKVTPIPEVPGCYKTDYTITKPGRVSILIPSCDHYTDLEKCVDSVYARTTYPDFEIIIIENNSKDPETFRCYERLTAAHPQNLKVLYWKGTGFNYSALNNFGRKEATGEYLLLLNNDTEVITPRWLEEMVMYAQQKRIGCVGAKLFYPDDTIQHAGVGFGLGGVAGHLHRYFPASASGYMGRLYYVQDLYCVTAACLLMRTEVYDEVNGLDESFAVAFNDVDLCVRVHEAGYTNLFTPFAQLYHYESKSRGLDDKPEKRKRFLGEVERFQKRWAKQLAVGDPYTNPNFDFRFEDFTLNILPME